MLPFENIEPYSAIGGTADSGSDFAHAAVVIVEHVSVKCLHIGKPENNPLVGMCLNCIADGQVSIFPAKAAARHAEAGDGSGAIHSTVAER